VNSKTGFLDDDVGPDTLDEFPLADDEGNVACSQVVAGDHDKRPMVGNQTYITACSFSLRGA